MNKASDKLGHLARASENAQDLAGTKSAKRRDVLAKNARTLQINHQIENGVDPNIAREVAAGTVPYETPESMANAIKDDLGYGETIQLIDHPDLEIQVTRLRQLYVTTTIPWNEFKRKYIATGAAAVEKIKIREKWDSLRMDFHNERVEAVAERFKADMEDALQVHNQLHLELSMLIGNKIRSVLPGITKPVEIQSCAVALKNIQSVSRLALGASTDNTALKSVDDFEEFLKGMKSGEKNEQQ